MGILAIQEAMMMILPPVLHRLSHQVRAGGPVLLLELGRVQRQLYLFHHIIPLAAKEASYQVTLLGSSVFLFIIGQLPV